MDDKRTLFSRKFIDPDLELRFQNQSSEQSIPNYRFSILLGLAVVLLFIFVDWWALPLSFQFAVTIRLAVISPALIAFLLFTYHPIFKKYVDWAITFPIIVAGAGIAAMIAHSSPTESAYHHYYVGLIVVNIWVTNMVKTKFIPTLFTMAINTIFYLYVALVSQNYLDSADFYYKSVLFVNLSFYFTISLVALLGNLIMEVYLRNEFLHSEIVIQNQKKLVNANRLSAIGELSAGVTHEISTPLSVIMLCAEQLNTKLKKYDIQDEYILNLPVKMAKASHTINQILKSMKLISRDGQFDEMQVEKLQTIIYDSTFLSLEKFQKSGVQLEIAQAPDISVKCQMVQISQVMVNLLNNAFDALRNQTEPKPLVKVEFHADPCFVAIKVSDNGPGIPKEILNKVATPFFTTKPVGQGTGLGLSLSKQIVEKHGGQFKITDFERGASFEFTLPIAKP